MCGMKKAQLIPRIIEKILLLPTLIWIYTPIIAGILITMTHYLPIAFASWWIFSFLGTGWLINLIVIRSDALGFLIAIEVILFILGLILFLWGLIYLANIRLKKQGLATGGPYRFNRHPQHLGIILMTLVNSLYIPWAVHHYIRVGSILSWSLFSLFMIIFSELEEKKLLKIYGNVYLDYRQETGMFFPRISKKNRRKRELTEIKHWKRIVFILVFYICFIALFRFIGYIVRLGMWYDSLSPRFWYINLVVLGLLLLNFGIRVIKKRIFSIDERRMH